MSSDLTRQHLSGGDTFCDQVRCTYLVVPTGLVILVGPTSS